MIYLVGKIKSKSVKSKRELPVEVYVFAFFMIFLTPIFIIIHKINMVIKNEKANSII